jgi:hypothetical protein
VICLHFGVKMHRSREPSKHVMVCRSRQRAASRSVEGSQADDWASRGTFGKAEPTRSYDGWWVCLASPFLPFTSSAICLFAARCTEKV